MSIYESDFEKQVLSWFAGLDYEVLPAENFDPAEEEYNERESTSQVIITGRLESAIREFNHDLSEFGVKEALRLVTQRDAADLLQNNLNIHRLLVDGVTVEEPDAAGKLRGRVVRLFDFEQPDRNNFAVTNQLKVEDRLHGTGRERIPDVVVYVNGMPLAVLELKNPREAKATIWSAYNQLQTYKKDIPSLFHTNCVLVVADGANARIGSLTADEARFQVWRTGREGQEGRKGIDPGHTLIEGVFDKANFLNLIRNFITFEVQPGRIHKKLGAYHQFNCVNEAVSQTIRAAGPKGDRKAGVVWHTQGSGKSLTMLFYAGKLVQSTALQNPTIVVVTDRNDLDDQLFGTFAMGRMLLRQDPVQVDSREALRDALKTASGGVIFTTIQKFLPEDGKPYPAISQRENVVVIADEAHRSQYGFGARVTQKGEIKYGLAKHLRDALPKASFIGFTGTPVELNDKNTRQVFGDYINVYDIQQAVKDQATVPIYYESRLAKLDLPEQEKPKVDQEFEDITEAEEADAKEALKKEWTALESLVGTQKRLSLIAKDLVEHFEKRQSTIEGKAMVVCFSRRICVDLYAEIVKLRPQWADDDLERGAIKVVMTGSASDPTPYQPHVTNKQQRQRLGARFKDPNDPLKLVLVRDMWLTGFDVPSLHSLYVDKPMRGHNLMQAIARVNRVFGNKPGGLVVDYIGIAAFLEEAVATYTQSKGRGDLTQSQDKAVELMRQNLELCREVFFGFDYSGFFRGSPQDRLKLLPAAREHVLGKRELVPEGKKKERKDEYDVFMEACRNLSAAFALAMPHPACEQVREEVAFFQSIRAGLDKLETGSRPPSSDLDHAIRQIVSNAIVSDRVIDVFNAAGLAKPDISGIGILSEEFLAQVGKLPYQNLAAAVLERLLRDYLASLRKKSVVRSQAFSLMLEEALRKLQNRAISTVEVIQELIDLARKMREQGGEADKLKLGEDEYCFYEALSNNQSARDVLGDPQLADIARELTGLVRREATLDWVNKRSVQTRLRVLVKRVLKKYGYPPDQQPAAIALVLDQAKALGINVTEHAGAAAAEGTDTEAEAELPLPFPVEVFDNLVLSQENRFHRVKLRLDGFERALTLVVAAEVGYLRSRGPLPAVVQETVGVAPGKPISMGSWLEWAWKIAAAIPENDSHPAAQLARAFVTPAGKQSQLSKDLLLAVKARNDLAHLTVADDAALAEPETRLTELWERLCAALGPLRRLMLVSKASIKDIGADEVHRYGVRTHIGGTETFPILELDLKAKLEDKWCYLTGQDHTALSLRPFIACVSGEKTQRPEIFVARAVAFDGKTPSELNSLLNDGKVKLVAAAG